MKSLIFDPFSGAAGDMILGSLIDLGADGSKIREIIESAVDVSVSVDRVNKKGIDATDVHIHVPHEEHSRHYHELVDIIKAAGLPSRVEKSALDVFEIMAKAESKVHGESLEEIHFHEVGQNDALADVIGSCAAIHEIGADSIFCTPVNVGGGRVRAAHGSMAVPAPATLEILRSGSLLSYGMGNRELLTPTGAALLSYFAKPLENLPKGRVLSVGYGAGDADTEDPNVLRTVLMETSDILTKDRIEVLETNVDDVTGEVLGNLFDKLLAAGARDVAITPTIMKKGRSGHIIKVITKAENSESVAREMMKETGTLGIRVIPTAHRFVADRRMDKVTITLKGEEFTVAVKIAQDKAGEILHMSAEYEDCRKVADKVGLPLKEIIRRVEEEAWGKFE
ncbi:nickel pincer cofactor biosynthesis protein LarC [Methanolobus mangrovi]|uniref:Putative nickel insertion protein n=1 Tax=Methanolobus mangrovi TaxID=3072977 RepID=A0AA51UKF3_9EURY|nr:nickel pincer cofactor biosynthesis protein LarC [Methanolobus mangrovi]WMW23336.1 nickel pincer cofactor biosynthesis protein LarC [Methanolobus mangrovi]